MAREAMARRTVTWGAMTRSLGSARAAPLGGGQIGLGGIGQPLIAHSREQQNRAADRVRRRVIDRAGRGLARAARPGRAARPARARRC